MKIKEYLDKLDSLVGKKVLLTGGTAGIGFCIAEQLLYKGADIVILARNKNKSLEVKKKLLEKYPDGHVDFINYDQSDYQSIENAVKDILDKHPDFYALICNAGIFACHEKGKSNLSMTYKTNCVGLGYFLKLLVPNLHNEHRIIIQGSLAAGYHLKKIHSLYDTASSWQHYLISKACVEALAYYYMEHGPDNLSFYLVEPGLAKTEITREYPALIRQLSKVFLKIFTHSAAKGALTAMLALQKDIKPCFIVPSSLDTRRGFPKIKAFPKKRQREDLLKMLNDAI